MDVLPAKSADRIIGESYRHKGKVVIWNGKRMNCEHNRRRSRCKECGGSQICEHNRIRSSCKECGGSQICEHNRQRSSCKECDLHGYIATMLRNRIYSAIINGSGEKAYSSIELLGCTINHCRIHLERQFSEEMSWDNHGEWHIDHRKPCAVFDLTDSDEQKKCFHYTNLQPMWADENIAKKDNFNDEDFDWEWNGSQWIGKL